MSVLEFYDQLAGDYHLIFQDWRQGVQRQGKSLDDFIRRLVHGAPDITVYDCSAGIGTQAIGLALQGYIVHATDYSPKAITRAQQEAESFDLSMTFGVADFRQLGTQVNGAFDVVISCDNSLPHLLTNDDLKLATQNLAQKINSGGLLLISIRDYDAILATKPTTTPLAVYNDATNQRRVSFQVWDWAENADIYTVNHYIITHSDELITRHHSTQYRALRRTELTAFLQVTDLTDIQWHMPEDSGYYQPIVTARKP